MNQVVLLATAALVLLLVSRSSDAYTYTKIAKGHNGKCLGRDGKVHVVGEAWWDDKKCEEATCHLSGKKYYETVYGCGVISGPKECKVVRGTGHYPNCCPDIQC